MYHVKECGFSSEGDEKDEKRGSRDHFSVLERALWQPCGQTVQKRHWLAAGRLRWESLTTAEARVRVVKQMWSLSSENAAWGQHLKLDWAWLAQAQSNFKTGTPGFAASTHTALKYCVCCFGLKTSNKSCFVLWDLPICLHLLSWQFCCSHGPRLAQQAGESREKSGRLHAERALISTCFTFPTLPGSSKPNPTGLCS